MTKVSDKIKEMLPDFVENCKTLFADDYEDFINSYDKNQSKSIRLNSAKIDIDFLQKNITGLTKSSVVDNMYFVSADKLTKHPYYLMGLYYFQEISASCPVNFLEFAETAKVLDMCAAPGGKTLQLAQKLSNGGLLYSNDISTSRQRATVKNIEKFGISNTIVMAENHHSLAENFADYFDVILVDAPCSGEGMFAKDIAIAKCWSEESVLNMAKKQLEILTSAAKMLKSGGKLMYSTCTFDVRENEGIIEKFLAENDQFYAEIIENDMFENGLGKVSESVIKASNRILPHKLNALGHYFILLGKKGELEISTSNLVQNKPPKYFSDFATSVGYKVKDGYYFEAGTKLYYMNHKVDLASNLRILRSGLLLGEVKSSKFIPSQAFAMTIRPSEIDNKIMYRLTDDNVGRYFRGETIAEKHKKGYHLVFVDEQPAGFVLSDEKKLKNKFKKDWILV